MKWIRRMLIFILLTPILAVGAFSLLKHLALTGGTEPYKSFLVVLPGHSQLKVQQLNKTHALLQAKMLIKNQTNVHFLADSMVHRLLISGKEVTHHRVIRPVTLAPGDSLWITFPAFITTERLENILAAGPGQKDSVNYKFETVFYTPLLKKGKFGVSLEKNLPVFRPVTVVVEKIEKDSVRWRGMWLYLHTRFKNQNPFSFSARETSYRLSVQDSIWMPGKRSGMLRLPAYADSVIILPLYVPSENVSLKIYDLLRYGSGVKYDFDISFRAFSDEPVVSGSTCRMSDCGKSEITKHKRNRGIIILSDTPEEENILEPTPSAELFIENNFEAPAEVELLPEFHPVKLDVVGSENKKEANENEIFLPEVIQYSDSLPK
ncbi:MAG TPA: LEA type 2 family protein [Bacteroidia bacterium]|nr:LEA type 2 family protein [Bacteroidia bacterium]